MNAQHTPGMWRFYTKPQPNGCPIVGANGLMVCMLAHSINHAEQEKEAIANARLIAAAPDMLSVLQHASHLNSFREFNDYLPTIRAAISKATGEQQ